ncbi:MAG: bifunctional non-ous end joining protein LigD [Solirubrobacteraceae bacterium]|jgi:bifunctional non-homologous end joining protein LigD|nr:bifunctional non-ous end joining protein LigD [Solirubrobacteraceae bacterium]
MAPRKLEQYRAKRDFAATTEPSGAADGSGGAGARRFVVQEHHATRLHWDLRLEHQGVLASWAIPNGIPALPSENRLAVHTEDHPLEYLDFEGDIPAGEYGAGTMRIWDHGTFETHLWDDKKVEVTFHGERLTGRYGLFPIGKGKDDEKDWMIHRMDPPVDPGRVAMPERVLPMLADACAELPRDESRWGFEVKWDGVRAIAYVKPGRLRLESRNLREITDGYPEVRGLLRDLGMREAVFDGELITFDEHGRPSFERLQRRMHVTSPSAVRRLAASTPVVYVIFDLLYLDGHDVMAQPYGERRAALEGLELGGPAWRVPAAHAGQGRALLSATESQGLEGVVAKRLDSRYEPGRRNGAWLKIKHTRRQELVVGGWLPGEGRRRNRIGALLMGYQAEDGRLRFAGRVGTGFTERTLEQLGSVLAPLETSASPFDPPPKLPRNAVFVRPELVAEVEFREWTSEGVMRAPSFKGLRGDKPAAEVIREGRGPATASEAGATGPGRGGRAGRVREGGQAGRVTQGGRGGEDGRGGEGGRGGESREGPVTPTELFRDAESLPDGGIAVSVDGRRLKLSNFDKVLYPETGFTKGDLIAYYARIAPAVLPHLNDRPLTLKRYPNGVQAPYFYEKQSPSHRPEWVQTARVGGVNYTLCQDRSTLVWLANLADIELHTSLALADRPERPTMLVFDLDPGPPAAIVECCQVGLVLRGLFAALGLESVAKTSGSKGLQVYVPLNTPVTYAQTKPFARRVAEVLEQRLPELVVSRMTKRLRGGKVLVDWSQNDEHKTTVTVYSVRARERPTVSAPVSWEEVRACQDAQDPDLLTFETGQVLERVASDGDPFAGLLSLRQALPSV